MYCNPSIPLDTDATELKRIFRAPPKSDGKNFNTFTLFELIRKLELKEIKTWAQLALDLGVEPPVLDKGQSAQKVQQYAVRLKVSSLTTVLDPACPTNLLTKRSGGCMPCTWMHFSSIFSIKAMSIGHRSLPRMILRLTVVEMESLQKKTWLSERYYPRQGLREDVGRLKIKRRVILGNRLLNVLA